MIKPILVCLPSDLRALDLCKEGGRTQHGKRGLSLCLCMYFTSVQQRSLKF